MISRPGNFSVRLDLNVPMENGRVTDVTRIERQAPHGNRGRPEGRQGDSPLPLRASQGTELEGVVATGGGARGAGGRDSARRAAAPQLY
jgi:hypothetical protein